MSSRCTVCKHEHRWRIELLRSGGAGLEALAKKFGLHRNAIDRHWQNHVSPEAKASFLIGPADFATLLEKAAKEGDCILDYLKIARGALLSQLAGMNEAGDARAVAYVVDKLVKLLEVYGKVTGELTSLSSLNITNNNVAVLAEHPAFLRTQAALLQALAPFPDARAAVVAALRSLDDDTPTALPVPINGKVIERVTG